MAVRYAALSACRKVVTDGNDNGTDGQTDGQTDRQSATQYAGMRPPPREEGRIIRHFQHHRNFSTRSSAQTLSVCLKKNNYQRYHVCIKWAV